MVESITSELPEVVIARMNIKSSKYAMQPDPREQKALIGFRATHSVAIAVNRATPLLRRLKGMISTVYATGRGVNADE